MWCKPGSRGGVTSRRGSILSLAGFGWAPPDDKGEESAGIRVPGLYSGACQVGMQAFALTPR